MGAHLQYAWMCLGLWNMKINRPQASETSCCRERDREIVFIRVCSYRRTRVLVRVPQSPERSCPAQRLPFFSGSPSSRVVIRLSRSAGNGPSPRESLLRNSALQRRSTHIKRTFPLPAGGLVSRPSYFGSWRRTTLVSGNTSAARQKRFQVWLCIRHATTANARSCEQIYVVPGVAAHQNLTPTAMLVSVYRCVKVSYSLIHRFFITCSGVKN